VYEIIVAEKGSASYSFEELFFGPFLLKEKSHLFVKKHEEELSKLKNIISKIPTDNTERTSLINEKIKIYDII